MAPDGHAMDHGQYIIFQAQEHISIHFMHIKIKSERDQRLLECKGIHF